ncbi:hypothetical protein BDB01DRAFT_757420 [Pilobolus umbonatus]|nr:hypothetical protein BDB01DRAFT_757420 [Pilobolus umbonatus]
MNNHYQSHLLVHLPEIVSHIISFLIPQEGHQENVNVNLYPCLFVNRLWHDCSFRIIWRRAIFGDNTEDLDSFIKLSKILCDPPSTFSSLPITTDPLISNDPPYSAIKSSTRSSSISKHNQHIFQQYGKELQSARVNSYRSALRMLSLRKIKNKSVNDLLSNIGQYTCRLEYLDIYICDHFTNDSLYSFLTHRTLTFLSLAGCNHISDEAVLKVAEYCHQLEHLDLRACGLVSDVSLSAIALNCPRLRHLNVGRIKDRYKVTIQSIALVAKHTQAGVLGLAGCDIDDECMRVLARYRSTGLERVSVNSCYKISNETVYAYMKYCPNLSVFEMKECYLINDWEAVAELANRKVLLTLCEQQNKACANWARRKGILLNVKAPLK